MSGVGLCRERNLVVKSGPSQLRTCPEAMELSGFCSLPSLSTKLVAQFLWKCFVLFVHSDGLCPVEAFTWGDYRWQEVRNNLFGLRDGGQVELAKLTAGSRAMAQICGAVSLLWGLFCSLE